MIVGNVLKLSGKKHFSFLKKTLIKIKISSNLLF